MANLFTLGSFITRQADGVLYKPLLPGFQQVYDFNADGYDDYLFPGAFYTFMGSAWVPEPGWIAFGTASGYRASRSDEFPVSALMTVHPREFAFVDFNGDGRTDIFIADHGYDASPFPGYQNQLFLSSGTTGWQLATQTLPQVFDFTHSTTAGDIDRDGDLDILVGNTSFKDISILLNDGHGSFQRNTSLLPIGSGQALDPLSLGGLTSSLLADLDGDGYAELTLGTIYKPPMIDAASRILWNNNGSFAAGNETVFALPKTFGNSQALYDIQATDINFDGRQDLILNYQQDGGLGGWEIQVLINKGGHEFEDQTAQWFTDTSVITSGIPQNSALPWFPFLRPRDLNGDGRTDFFIGGTPVDSAGIPVANAPVMLIQQPDGKLAPITVGDLQEAGMPNNMFFALEFVRRGVAGEGELVTQYYDDFQAAQGMPKFNSYPIQFATPASLWHAGTAQNDSLSGSAAADWFGGFAGNDTIDGGAGIDLARYTVNRNLAALTKTATGWTISCTADGSDTLTGMERLQFADGFVAIDLDGSAGKVARLLGALFGKEAVANKTYAGLGLGLLDSGMSYADLTTAAINTTAFQNLAGGKSNGQLVDLIYRNVVGVTPDTTAHNYYVGLLDQGLFTQTALAQLAADTPLNALKIDLAGLMTTGLAYNLWQG